MSIDKVSFGTTKIQALRRITLDQNLMQTLGLSIGDDVCVELDIQHEAVRITRVPVEYPSTLPTSAQRSKRAKK